MRFFALAFVFAVSCSSVALGPASRTAFDAARDAIAIAQLAHSDDSATVRRLEIADSALRSVQLAHDARELQAAAPCAVTALRDVAPDLKSVALKQALSIAISALEKVGGTCNVDGRDDDAGVPD